MMNDRGKSDQSVVPEKLPNEADSHAEEAVEGRERAKGNPTKRDRPWTLSQPGLPSALERVGRNGTFRRLTQGKSRIWEICTSGSVRGVESDLYPYRDQSLFDQPHPVASKGRCTSILG
jgi:hypothetical protein